MFGLRKRQRKYRPVDLSEKDLFSKFTTYIRTEFHVALIINLSILRKQEPLHTWDVKFCGLWVEINLKTLSMWALHGTDIDDDDEYIKASVIFRKGKATFDDEICVSLSLHPAIYPLTPKLVSYFREAYYKSKNTNML
jgi:hypothetical protein